VPPALVSLVIDRGSRSLWQGQWQTNVLRGQGGELLAVYEPLEAG
jgi:hypothetical protein